MTDALPAHLVTGKVLILSKDDCDAIRRQIAAKTQTQGANS